MSRDLRDPTAFGQACSELKKKYPHLKMSDIADIVGRMDIPDYSSSGISTESRDKYVEELKRRDDRYAKARLKEIEEGIDLGPDPSGD